MSLLQIRFRWSARTLDIELNASLAAAAYGVRLGAAVKIAVLSRADLTGADLTGANLSWAHLPKGDLRRARLSGANVRDADLHRANLEAANLQGADTDLARADLSAVKKFRIRENMNFEFRAEFLDAFNNINFLIGSPNVVAISTGANSSTFGRTNQAYQDLSTTSDPGGRLIQLVARFNF